MESLGLEILSVLERFTFYINFSLDKFYCIDYERIKSKEVTIYQ